MERFSFINRLLAVCIMLLSTNSVFAAVKQQDAAKAQQLLSKSMRGFEENKGQIVDQYHQPNADVHYLFRSPGLNVQLRNNGFSYDSYRDEIQDNGKDESSLSMQRDIPHSNREVSIEHKDIKRHIHRVDIELVGANAHPIMTALSALPSMNNYYTGDKNIENVRSYERVIYTNIYPSIDLEFFISTEGKPEYQFYVRPGGDAKNIRLRYNGALKTYLSDGKIMMDVAHGSIAEHIPLSYLSQSKEEVTVRYKQIGTNEFGCEAPSYSATETLVIDPMPQLSWGTYYGGLSYDLARSISTDSQNNIYVTGETNSSATIASSGAHQTTFGSATDMFVAKFSNDGARLWATYMGGSSVDVGTGIITDPFNNVYIVGYSFSSTGIASVGAFQEIKSGGSDAFVVKFNSNGNRIWSTYCGGNDNDFGNAIAFGASGTIYIVGTTLSVNGIATSGSHLPSYSGNFNEDAFLVKFNDNGNRVWGTYYGGLGRDYGIGVATDQNENVYIVGQASSGSGIASSGAHKTSPGGADAFLVKFNSSGVRQWGTYYGGTNGDMANGVTTDNAGNIYFVGSTVSASGISTTNAHQVSQGGGTQDGFLAKFNTNGILLWGTYYGGTQSDILQSVTVDVNSNILVCGTTSSQTLISSTDSHQTTYGGGTDDAFVASFTSNGARRFGSYYGGALADQGLAITSDNQAHFYLVGSTASTSGFATSGAHQTTYGGGTSDAFIAKFSQIVPPNSLSDIIATPGFVFTDNIPYHLYQSASLTASNSVAMMGLTIRDGGVSGDDDEYPTILTSLTLSLSNAQLLRRVALFDGDTKLAEVDASSTVTFTGLTLSVADNSSKNITVRASFASNVDDNEQIGIIVTSVSSLSANSGFALSNGGGAASSAIGDNNRVEVTADRLRFVDQPSSVDIDVMMQPDVSVEAIDELNNRDLDVEGREVFIMNRMLKDSPVAALLDAGGVAHYGTLTFAAASPFEQLTASSPGYQPGLSASFAIKDPSAIDNRIVHFHAGSNVGPDNTPLNLWDDVAGNDDNAEQTVMARRPVLRNSAAFLINSHPVVQFGVGRGMQIVTRPELSGGTSKTMFAVIRTGANVTNRQMIMELGGISGGFNMYIDGFRLYAGAWDQLRAWHLHRQVLPNRVYLVQYVYDGNRNRLSLNSPGSIIEAGTVAVNFRDPDIQGGSQLSGLGAVSQQTRYHNGYSFVEFGDPFLGQIAEAVVLNSANFTQRSAIFNELNQKYAIGALSNPLLKEIEEELVEEYTEATPSINVYPNPVHSSSSIYYHVPVSGDYSVVLQDVLGNIVMEIVKGTQNSGTYSTELHADALMSGMYRLVLTTSMGTISTPIVIQK
jgi:hypothetical protein